MASSVTKIATTRYLETSGENTGTAVVALTGNTKIVAEDMGENDVVTIYEETGTEGNYQEVIDIPERKAILTAKRPSIIFIGFGNYKFLLGPQTNESLVVGYAQ